MRVPPVLSLRFMPAMVCAAPPDDAAFATEPGGSDGPPEFFGAGPIPDLARDDLEADEVDAWKATDRVAGGPAAPLGRWAALAAGVALTWPPQSALAQPEPAPTTASEPATAPASEPAQTAVPEGPATEPAVPTAVDTGLFDVLVGEELAFGMRDGSEFRGRLLAVQTPWLLCARAGDGRVVAVMQAEVAAVRAAGPMRPRPAPDVETGDGRIAAGIALLAAGGVMLIGGIWAGIYGSGYSYSYYGEDESTAYYWAPIVAPAIVAVGVGIPLLVRGLQIRKDHRAKEGRRVAWDGGLRWRF